MEPKPTELQELQAKLEHAEKQCAALRLGIASMTALVINHHAIKGPQDRFGFCETCTSESGKLLWEDHDEAWRIAKSSDCGSNYVPKSELDTWKLKLANEEEECAKWQEKADKLREALRKIADISQLTNVTFEVQAFTAADIAITALKEGQ